MSQPEKQGPNKVAGSHKFDSPVRAVRADKRSFISPEVPSILTRLEVTARKLGQAGGIFSPQVQRLRGTGGSFCATQPDNGPE